MYMVAENKFTSIGPIYYEYGSMVITYEDASKAVRALYALREAKYEDKHLLGKYQLSLLKETPIWKLNMINFFFKVLFARIKNITSQTVFCIP